MFKAEIFGRLGADAEERFTSGGKKVINLRMAVNTRRGRDEETIWVRVTIWADTFGEDRLGRLMPYLKKGSALIISGKMQKPGIWTNSEGQAQVNVEMTADSIDFNPFGRSTEEGAGAPGTNFHAAAAPAPQATPQSQPSADPFAGMAQAPAGGGASVPEDDLPF